MADLAERVDAAPAAATWDRQDRMTADSAVRRASVLVLKVLAYAWLVIFALATALPLIWMISTAIKPNELVLKMPPVLIPAEPTIEHFRTFFRQMNAWRWIFNSVVVVTVITLAHVTFYTMAGYAFAKLTFPGRRILFGLVLATLTIPLYVILVPLYKMMVDLGWINTYQGLILPALVGPSQPLPDEAVHVDAAVEPHRLGARRRVPGMADLHADHRAARPSRHRGPRDLHVHGLLEQLHLAARRHPVFGHARAHGRASRWFGSGRSTTAR